MLIRFQLNYLHPATRIEMKNSESTLRAIYVCTFDATTAGCSFRLYHKIKILYVRDDVTLESHARSDDYLLEKHNRQKN